MFVYIFVACVYSRVTCQQSNALCRPLNSNFTSCFWFEVSLWVMVFFVPNIEKVVSWAPDMGLHGGGKPPASHWQGVTWAVRWTSVKAPETCFFSAECCPLWPSSLSPLPSSLQASHSTTYQWTTDGRPPLPNPDYHWRPSGGPHVTFRWPLLPPWPILPLEGYLYKGTQYM